MTDNVKREQVAQVLLGAQGSLLCAMSVLGGRQCDSTVHPGESALMGASILLERALEMLGYGTESRDAAIERTSQAPA